MRIIMVLLALTVSGCSSLIKPDAFAPGKRYALVSVITEEKLRAPDQGSTVSGLIKAVASEDAGFSASSEKVFEETAPRLVKALLSQKRISVLPERVTRSNPGFAAMASDEPVQNFGPFSTRYRIAQGYKYFSDEQKLGQLAKAMNVDGVIVVRMYYTVTQSGVGFLGLVSAGTHSGGTIIEASAVDRSGQLVWHDRFQETSEDSIGFVGEAVNFVKLHPLVVQSADAAIKTMVTRLENEY